MSIFKILLLLKIIKKYIINFYKFKCIMNEHKRWSLVLSLKKKYKIPKWMKCVFPPYKNTKLQRFQLKSYKSIHKDNITQERFISVQLISQKYYICSYLQSFNLVTKMIQMGGWGESDYNTLALHGKFFF